ncbi:hypothetical protein [Rudanella lutea]|uniref:hypothetical protein n=1 Tax=Rudanella lutea TaxID=451374 RepID=UPI0003712CD0|nr:hypothetical protein [Rudanella lutea]
MKKRIVLILLALLPLLLALLPLLAQGQITPGLRYSLERNKRTGELIGKLESGIGSDVFVTTPVATLRAASLTPSRVAIPKPVDVNYTLVPGAYNPERNGRFNLPNLSFLDYLRRTDISLGRLLRRQDYFSHQGVLPAEESDASVWRRVNFELSGGALQELEGSRPFFLATTQQVLNKLATTSMGINKNVAFVVTNFETCYPLFPTSEAAVISGYGPLTQTIVIEQEGARKGQTMTLGQVWAEGQSFFHAEEAMRFTNRHVAITLWLKALVPNAQVANGDGANVYYQRSPVFDESNDYPSFAAGTAAGNFFFTTTANQPALTAGGLTVVPSGKKFWQAQDWINNYIYPGSHRLPAADFDALAASGPTSYTAVWPKLKPDLNRYDAMMVAFDYINRQKIGKPYTLQTHYRDENGYWKENTFYPVGDPKAGQPVTGKFAGILSDEAVCPPWHHYAVAAWTGFLGQSKNDRLTVWRTHRKYPTGGNVSTVSPGNPDYVYNRPHADREAYDAGFSAIGKYAEYLTSAATRYYPHDLYIKYPGLTGSGWGTSAVMAGSGYYKRNIRDIVFRDNPSDRRTKAIVGMRTVVKNGAVWALIIGTNWGQEAADVTTFDLLVRKADVPTLAADVEVTGLKITGYNTTIVEVCLEPARLTQTLSATTATTTPSTPFGFAYTPITTNTTVPSTGKIVIQGTQIRNEWWITHNGAQFGGALCHVSRNGGGNFVNNFDAGRQHQDTYYGGPDPYSPPGFEKPEYWKGFPYNPIEGGDWAHNGSDILAYGFDNNTGTHYLKTRARNFPVRNYLTGFVYEKWARPVHPQAIRHWKKITWNRANDQVPEREADGSLKRFPTVGTQEHPVLYSNNGVVWRARYANESGVQNVDLRPLAYGTANWRGLRDELLAEGWFGLTGDTDEGVFYIGPRIGMIMGGTDGLEGTGEFADRSTYLANTVQKNIDPTGVEYMTYDVFTGTVAEARAYAAAYFTALGIDGVPNYDFSTGRRHNWACLNGILSLENTGNALTVERRTSNEGLTLKMPQFPFSASAMPTLYIRVKNNSTSSTLRVAWQKPSQKEGPALIAGQYYDFTVPNDGAFHTVPIVMTGRTGWTGIISAMTLGFPANPGTGTNLLQLTYFGKNNP